MAVSPNQFHAHCGIAGEIRAAHMVLFDEWFCPGRSRRSPFLLLGRHRDLLRSEVGDRSTLNSEVERRFVSIRNQRGGGGRKRERKEAKH